MSGLDSTLLGELIDQTVVMIGRRRYPYALGALGDGRIVDRLDAVLFQQDVAGALAAFRVADEQIAGGSAVVNKKPGA